MCRTHGWPTRPTGRLLLAADGLRGRRTFLLLFFPFLLGLLRTVCSLTLLLLATRSVSFLPCYFLFRLFFFLSFSFVYSPGYGHRGALYSRVGTNCVQRSFRCLRVRRAGFDSVTLRDGVRLSDLGDGGCTRRASRIRESVSDRVSLAGPPRGRRPRRSYAPVGMGAATEPMPASNPTRRYTSGTVETNPTPKSTTRRTRKALSYSKTETQPL